MWQRVIITSACVKEFTSTSKESEVSCPRTLPWKIQSFQYRLNLEPVDYKSKTFTMQRPCFRREESLVETAFLLPRWLGFKECIRPVFIIDTNKCQLDLSFSLPSSWWNDQKLTAIWFLSNLFCNLITITRSCFIDLLKRELLYFFNPFSHNATFWHTKDL